MVFLGVYGHVNVDHVLLVKQLPRPDQTVPVEKDLMRLGGTAGNVSRCAQSLGVPTAVSACIGDDFPPAFLEQLQASGIDLTDLRRLPGATPKIWIMSLPDGSQSAIIDQGVMGDGVARPKRDYTYLKSTWVHFTTGPADEHLGLAREAKSAGKRVAFDPAQELSYRYPGRLFEKFLNESHLFTCNAAELKLALEALGYGEPEQLLDHTEAVLGTMGPKGSWLLTEKGRVEVPACPVRGEAPKDAVGAGDAYRAGLYAALHAGKPLSDGLRWGSAAASLFLEARCERFPTGEELRTRLGDWRV